MTNSKHFTSRGRGSSGRIAGLDLLRISLAILIYMFHSWMHFGCSYSVYLDKFVSVGAVAMTGFFLLSGYALRLVYGKQDLMEKHNLGRFYLKRILSIIPLYYFFALLYILISGKESMVDNMLLLPIEALGLQTTFTSLFGISHNSGTWFISCLLLAYLTYPFLQTICKQMGGRSKVLLLLILIFIDIWGVIISRHFNTAWTYDDPFYRIIELTCGLLVADLNIGYSNKFMQVMRSWGALICSTVILFVGVTLMRYYFKSSDYMLYNIVALPSFIIMLFSLGTLKMSMIKESNLINYFGKLSYAFFLVQFFAWIVGEFVLSFFGYDSNMFRIAITLSYCIIASILVYEIVQKPIVKFVNMRVLNYDTSIK